jgi:hypothetical protein
VLVDSDVLPVLPLPSVVYEDEGTSMAVLQMCVDESGKLSDTHSVAFAGCVAYEDDWRGLTRRWDAALRSVHVEYIGMGEAMSCTKQFKCWRDREDERDELLIHLAGVAQKYACAFFGTPITSEFFNSLPDSERRRLRNPVYMGFESCLDLVLRQAVKSKRHWVQMYCDLSEEYSTECLRMFNVLRMRRPEVKEYFRSLTFADESVFAPLQLADMYAYCIRERSTGPVRPIIQELLDIFQKNDPYASHFACEWKDGLGSMTSTAIVP